MLLYYVHIMIDIITNRYYNLSIFSSRITFQKIYNSCLLWLTTIIAKPFFHLYKNTDRCGNFKIMKLRNSINKNFA